uniref:Endo/exonuclease/phosphatase domain-containing protein n=1 Tax=Steinernema glaseri TaxID=37863 RepID=A0A1I7YHE4_9BILA
MLIFWLLSSIVTTVLAAPRLPQATTVSVKTHPNSVHAVTTQNGNLKVMTFNIWLSGAQVTDGMKKIAKHIVEVNPDVIALQEVETNETIPELLKLMGPEWTGVFRNRTYPDVGILTRHAIVVDSQVETEKGIGVHIALKSSDKMISFWCVHLEYRSYGPYAAFNKMVTDRSQIFAGELNTAFVEPGRVQNMQELVINEEFLLALTKSDKTPVFVCGDFNAPSHQDWINATKHLHGDWEFPWPATKILVEHAGMIDSFREAHPDPLETPGNTWSTVQKFSGKEWGYSIPEPQDRIDFIFYRSPQLAIRDSRIYSGSMHLNPIPYHQENDYPSDHFSVITDFYFKQQ